VKSGARHLEPEVENGEASSAEYILADGSDAASLWRIVLRIKAFRSKRQELESIFTNEDISNIVIGSHSRWSVMKAHFNLVQALRSTYVSNHDLLGYTNSDRQAIDEMQSVWLTSDGVIPVTPQSLGEKVAEYEATYAAFTSTHMTCATETVKAGDVAGKVTYQFWSQSRLSRVVLVREQLVPKLFKRVPPTTRTQRYGILCSAFSHGILFPNLDVSSRLLHGAEACNVQATSTLV